MAKMNSRWRGTHNRYSEERSVDDVRFLVDSTGHKRRVSDSPNEVEFCERRHEGPTFRKGARVRRR